MQNNLNTLLNKAECCIFCIHLIVLNIDLLKVVVAMGLKVVASKSPAKASPSYKISSKFISRLKCN
jgi:hypothetical protein